MTRKYDARRRKKAAEQTRSDILQSAMKLHWHGITEFEPLAREAGCSLATLRKYFPSKEVLFGSCSQTFGETLVMPDLPALSAITDISQRIEENISELCRMHEAMFGYAWLGAQQRHNSPTLDAVMSDYESLADAIAGIISTPDTQEYALLRGLLDFLSYRALRLSAKLSPEQTKVQLTRAIQQII